MAMARRSASRLLSSFRPFSLLLQPPLACGLGRGRVGLAGDVVGVGVGAAGAGREGRRAVARVDGPDVEHRHLRAYRLREDDAHGAGPVLHRLDPRDPRGARSRRGRREDGLRGPRAREGAILVLCSVGGVQSQSITVDRQMRRYEIPRVAFINKLDRMGADPWKVLNQARSKLRHHNAALQVPIGLEEEFAGLVDLVELKAYKFEGSSGQNVTTSDVPTNMQDLVNDKRRELIEVVSEVDDQLAEAFLNDEPITASQLKAAI